ncbi:hypothetical protein GCM10010423_64730 [Streptomyces levis]|uniref:Uncharacterized protein n=1 Tax=Streptomyces levis TaxID=285566 RepID=A0ABN3P2W4_9ACTN
MALAAEGMTIRSLLEHVGIDTSGKDIYVGDKIVDKAEPPKKDPMEESRERAQAALIEHMNVANAFNKELAALLNKYSAEEHSNTPDFILAQYLVTCLDAFTVASRNREEWYGEFFSPGKRSEKVIRKEEQDG